MDSEGMQPQQQWEEVYEWELVSARDNLTDDEKYEQYKRMLMDWYHKIEEYKKIKLLLSSLINQWYDLEENNAKLKECWIAINAEVYRREQVVWDALGEWFRDRLLEDKDLPRWDKPDIILNQEAWDTMQDENEKKAIATLAELAANARPYNPSKDIKKEKDKVKRRTKAKKAKRERKK